MKILKQSICGLLVIAMLSALTACGSSNTSSAPSQNSSQAESTETSDRSDVQTEVAEDVAETSQENQNATLGGNILIAYFTAAENSGVDAVASASYTTMDGVAVGRLRAVANMIQENTGGELFSIQTSVVYPADGGELIDYAAEEQDKNARPELTNQIENLDQYDTIFVGYPTWWYDMPRVLYSFFDAYDFTGKTIIPFNVHNGSRFSGTIDTIKGLEPGATVIEDGFTVSEQDVAEAADDVANWVNGL